MQTSQLSNQNLSLLHRPPLRQASARRQPPPLRAAGFTEMWHFAVTVTPLTCGTAIRLGHVLCSDQQDKPRPLQPTEADRLDERSRILADALMAVRVGLWCAGGISLVGAGCMALGGGVCEAWWVGVPLGTALSLVAGVGVARYFDW
jgi:hypothetical protein